MKSKGIPGELPHTAPSETLQERLLKLRPYVREAQEGFRTTWNLKPRRLFDFLLVNVLEGTGTFTIGGTRYAATAGDLFWIPPNTQHEMRGDAPGTRLQYIHFDLIYDPRRSHWSAHIPGGTSDLSGWPSTMHPPINDPIIGSWSGKMEGHNPVQITELLHRIVLEYNRSQISTLAVAGSVLQLIGHLLGSRHNDSTLATHHVNAIENAMRQIQLHYDEQINIETLARQHGLSPTHFRRLFREHYQQSPRDAHLAEKMRRACDDLVYSDLTITEIADRIGFTNVHNFSRAFRKTIGQPPSAYRAGQPLP
ncbi:AraC family transcriptional regulator [Pontiella sulfatireligans]|uniref:HTH-type transcriptional activator Btr n=1 Tax=Pontiella sulfatireligans TaxID=2750658 RepID=A0A6C2UST8_9BACT|nr:AraC family transcriptional regulator [Pontiella sulfatireligans]VGO21966.1 HTH-type transcriptional activator Btr [Pontiella sulfatireligans]